MQRISKGERVSNPFSLLDIKLNEFLLFSFYLAQILKNLWLIADYLATSAALLERASYSE